MNIERIGLYVMDFNDKNATWFVYIWCDHRTFNIEITTNPNPPYSRDVARFYKNFPAHPPYYSFGCVCVCGMPLSNEWKKNRQRARNEKNIITAFVRTACMVISILRHIYHICQQTCRDRTEKPRGRVSSVVGQCEKPAVTRATTTKLYI